MWALAVGIAPRLLAQVTEYRWQARYRDHEVPNAVTFVDADGDGRAEVVRVRVRVHQPKGSEWGLSPVRLGVDPERPDDSLIMGGAVGSMALDARIRGPRLGQTFSTKDSSEATLDFEFDAEEVRFKLRGRGGTILFEVNRMLNAESASPDGDRYRSKVAPIQGVHLGWLPGRLLGVDASIRDGRIEFSTRIEADRDADCPIRASVSGLSRRGWVDSLVVIPVKTGVTPANFSIALPRGLPSDLDSLMLQLHVTDIRGPLFPGKFWQRGVSPLKRGGR